MMAHVIKLTRWEWHKLRRRWLPWIMLALLLVVTQAFIWGTYFFSGDEQNRDLYDDFTMPGSLVNALGLSYSIGIFLIVILAGSVLGTEYRWRTVRSILARGTGRWQYLASKALLLALVAGGALLIVMAATAVSSLIAGALAGDPPTGSSDAPGWVDVPITFGKAWFVFLPYVALAGLFTVLTASSAAGIAISLVYYYAESIIVAIFLSFFDWFQPVADYVLGRNAVAWMTSGDGGLVVNFILGGRFGDYPGALHAFLVLAAYAVVLGGLTVWVFRRRDLNVS